MARRTPHPADVATSASVDSPGERALAELSAEQGVTLVTIGELLDANILKGRAGHGTPSHREPTDTVPYVQRSDLRSLRVTVNPATLVPSTVARTLWGSVGHSDLQAWDVIAPARASGDMSAFAILLPGEQRVVLSEELVVLRVIDGASDGWDPFYLLWALCLPAVRQQWRCVTERTDSEGAIAQYRDLHLPAPRSRAWAVQVSAGIRAHFLTLADSESRFRAHASDSALDAMAADVAGEAEEGVDTDTPILPQGAIE